MKIKLHFIILITILLLAAGCSKKENTAEEIQTPPEPICASSYFLGEWTGINNGKPLFVSETEISYDGSTYSITECTETTCTVDSFGTFTKVSDSVMVSDKNIQYFRSRSSSLGYYCNTADFGQYVLKITGTIEENDKTGRYLFADNGMAYPLTVTVENVSGTVSSEPVCSIRAATPELNIQSSSILENFPVSGLQKNAGKSITVAVNYEGLTTPYADTGLIITITDKGTGKEWTDFIPLRFYKGLVPVSIAAESVSDNKDEVLNGIILYPDGNSRFFSIPDGKSRTLFMPSFGKGERSFVAFRGALKASELSDSTEMYYTLESGACTAQIPQKDESAENLEPYSAFSGNNHGEETAYPAEGPINACLSQGEIDYYFVECDPDAVFTEDQLCYVSFVTDYGTNPEILPVVKGMPVTEEQLPLVYHKGDEFYGWYTSSKCIEKVSILTIQSDTTLYAGWDLLKYISISQLESNIDSWEKTKEYTVKIADENPDLSQLNLLYDYLFKLDLSECVQLTSIEDQAFKSCTGLTEVILPDSVRSIGSEAFSGCSGLTRITIPGRVNSIGASAFYGCTSLTGITLPYRITSIDTAVFQNCSRLTRITIPESVTSIGNNAFRGCNRLRNVTIPASVTAIGSSAFHDCSALTGISIPAGVTTVGPSAFSGCSGITELSVPAFCLGSFSFSTDKDYAIKIVDEKPDLSRLFILNRFSYSLDLSDCIQLSVINNYAFQNCRGLTGIVLPESITIIGSSAFYGCSGLTGINLPVSVTTISSGAFYGCTGLTDILLPENVTTIGSFAFYGCTGLAGINIPDTVTEIESCAFYECTNLTDIIIPDSVTIIGSSAFYGCSALTNAVLSKNITSIASNLFYGCSKLGSITLPKNITSIGSSAFYGCQRLSGILIPDSVTSIGSSAFRDCSGIIGVVLPDNLVSINNHAFRGCSSLLGITIPPNVTTIGSSAFADCSRLTRIIIPSSVVSIGSSAFSGCNELTNLTIPISFISIISLNQSKRYVIKLRDEKPDLSKLSSLKKYSFRLDLSDCKKMTSISSSAFRDYSELTEIILPDSITSIGNQAFEGCSSLAGITLPDGVETIGKYAFNECINLSSIRLPNSVKSIGAFAFDSCSSLRKVTISDLKAWLGISFNNASSNPLCNAHHLYMNGYELKKITVPEGISSIGNYMFYGCSGLTSITLPESVTSIGTAAFDGCSSLTGIILPESIISIGKKAFDGCVSLTSLLFSDASTWYGSASSNNKGGMKIDVSDASQNASKFKENSDFSNYYWSKRD